MAVRKDARIDILLGENRIFHPDEAFTARANVRDKEIYAQARADRLAFWAGQAERLDWFQKWDRILDWDSPPFAKWFVNGKLNVCYNCVDRHSKTWRKNKAAIIFEGEPGDSRILTYWELYRDVNRFANVLRRLGVGKGDRVAIYMPMIPELAVAMLACARIGAPHSIVFGGFSAESLRDRINDAGARLLITADGGWRRGKVVPLKYNADSAVEQTPSIENVLVVRRTGQDVPMQEGRDLWYHELVQDVETRCPCPCETMDAEDMLFILYTSGTTGKPKGIVHTSGGYLVGASMTHSMIFDVQDSDVYWCTADIGWITGHSYVVYGPLANGATTLMYEGAPDWPDHGRFWEICEKYGVNIFYTAPTAIRSFMKWGRQWPAKYDLSSLRLLGTVGEPINPEAWMWYYRNIGRENCPIVDTWWQTETGMIMVSPLPGITPLKPGSATVPMPGVEVDVVDKDGAPVMLGKSGLLVVKEPWPSMLRTVYGDDERYIDQYWSRFPGMYFAGDGARRDYHSYYWILGRVDDVINVAGHRLSTMEVESALVDHPAVAEAAAIGKNHALKGQAIAVFVTLKSRTFAELKNGTRTRAQMQDELKAHVVKRIGAIARPDDIFLTAEVPKTRSGKIMRRLLRDIAEGRALGDTTTLADPAVIAELKKKYETEES